MSSIIEATVVDGAGEEHGSFGIELPEVPDYWRYTTPRSHETYRYVTEPFTDNVFKVTLQVEYVGVTV